jgi:hypothetical protein
MPWQFTDAAGERTVWHPRWFSRALGIGALMLIITLGVEQDEISSRTPRRQMAGSPNARVGQRRKRADGLPAVAFTTRGG